VGGWIQQGVTFNPDSPVDGVNGPLATNDHSNAYQLNQAWLYFVRPTNTDGCGWDVGGRFDMVFGSDWRFGMTNGLEDKINGNGNEYGLVLPQMYIDVAYNDLTIRMGHFATFTSYEVVPAPLNFFYSHAYCMSGYFDPLLVTGVMTDYKLNDNWTILNGFHRGQLMFDDTNDKLNYLGGFKWACDCKRTTLSLMVDVGPEDPAGVQTRTSAFLVLTHRIDESLQYAMQYTYGQQEGVSTYTAGQNAEWYGICQWLTYTIDPKWSAGARLEWMRDDDGARVVGLGTILGSTAGSTLLPGFAGDFYDLSFGLNYRPNGNFLFRPEVRWDWYDGTTNLGGDLPFDDGNSNSQFTMAMDLIVTF
jgi:hypothetical protein